MTVILSGTVGSTAYGLGHPLSDVDRLSVWVAPTTRTLGFGLLAWEETRRQHGPDPHDVVEHEVAKFLHLCLKGNPSVQEMLWLEHYDVRFAPGQWLIEARESLLSGPAVAAAYGGYAADQVERLRRAGRFPDVPRSRIEKHGRHCARLLIQGRGLLASGHLRVRLTETEVDYVRRLGVLAGEDADAFAAEMAVQHALLKRAEQGSSLPAAPDIEAVTALLVRIRLLYAR